MLLTLALVPCGVLITTAQLTCPTSPQGETLRKTQRPWKNLRNLYRARDSRRKTSSCPSRGVSGTAHVLPLRSLSSPSFCERCVSAPLGLHCPMLSARSCTPLGLVCCVSLCCSCVLPPRNLTAPHKGTRTPLQVLAVEGSEQSLFWGFLSRAPSHPWSFLVFYRSVRP